MILANLSGREPPICVRLLPVFTPKNPSCTFHAPRKRRGPSRSRFNTNPSDHPWKTHLYGILESGIETTTSPRDVRIEFSLACGWWPILADVRGSKQRPRRSFSGAFSDPPAPSHPPTTAGRTQLERWPVVLRRWLQRRACGHRSPSIWVQVAST